MNNNEKLTKVLSYVKSVFVGKDDIIDILGVCLIARENAFILGPPGTAKSAITRTLSECFDGGKNFEYLLTRFTEPNEIFGPFDIRKLKEGELITNTEGMLPEASLVFLDEIFNANSAILNSLLMALNERIFRRGKETKKLPALMFVGASNQLPEEESLNALLDRFLIRVKSDYVDPDLLEQVLIAGWELKCKESEVKPNITPQEIIELQNQCNQVELGSLRKQYVEIVHTLRNAGIKVSDRRAVKIQNLIAASALISGRNVANVTDLWVLKHIWDTEEQIEILSGILDKIIDAAPNENSHPQSRSKKAPNAEEILADVQALKQKWEQKGLSFEEQSVIKDKLRFIQTRSNWIKEEEHRQYIENSISELWQSILKTI